ACSFAQHRRAWLAASQSVLQLDQYAADPWRPLPDLAGGAADYRLGDHQGRLERRLSCRLYAGGRLLGVRPDAFQSVHVRFLSVGIALACGCNRVAGDSWRRAVVYPTDAAQGALRHRLHPGVSAAGVLAVARWLFRSRNSADFALGRADADHRD